MRDHNPNSVTQIRDVYNLTRTQTTTGEEGGKADDPHSMHDPNSINRGRTGGEISVKKPEIVSFYWCVDAGQNCVKNGLKPPELSGD